MDRGCKQTGVKRIRIHDLRHSHISLLKVYKALRDQLSAVLDELRRIEAGQSVNDELLDTIRTITTIMNGMQEEFAYDR